MSTSANDPAGETGIFTAEELRRRIAAKHEAKALEDLKRHKALEEEEKHKKEAFLAQKLTPELIATANKRIAAAVEREETELLVGQFPAAWCTDYGRQIGQGEPTWPDTLTGLARDFYEHWRAELKPKGFRLRAQILDFPNGLPGDVGLSLGWAEWADGDAAPPSGS